MAVDPNSRRPEQRDLGVVVVPVHVHAAPTAPSPGDGEPPAAIGLPTTSHGAHRRGLATFWQPILFLGLVMLCIALWKGLR